MEILLALCTEVFTKVAFGAIPEEFSNFLISRVREKRDWTVQFASKQDQPILLREPFQKRVVGTNLSSGKRKPLPRSLTLLLPWHQPDRQASPWMPLNEFEPRLINLQFNSLSKPRLLKPSSLHLSPEHKPHDHVGTSSLARLAIQPPSSSPILHLARCKQSLALAHNWH